MTGLHEAQDRLQSDTIEMHRAIESLREELEAVDWYQQRADSTEDDELRDILLHNMDEEMEHAVMVLEWMRRKNQRFDHYLRTLLFSDASITDIEHGPEAPSGQTLKIGSLRQPR